MNARYRIYQLTEEKDAAYRRTEEMLSQFRARGNWIAVSVNTIEFIIADYKARAERGEPFPEPIALMDLHCLADQLGPTAIDLPQLMKRWGWGRTRVRTLLIAQGLLDCPPSWQRRKKCNHSATIQEPTRNQSGGDSSKKSHSSAPSGTNVQPLGNQPANLSLYTDLQTPYSQTKASEARTREAGEPIRQEPGTGNEPPNDTYLLPDGGRIVDTDVLVARVKTMQHWPPAMVPVLRAWIETHGNKVPWAHDSTELIRLCAEHGAQRVEDAVRWMGDRRLMKISDLKERLQTVIRQGGVQGVDEDEEERRERAESLARIYRGREQQVAAQRQRDAELLQQRGGMR